MAEQIQAQIPVRRITSGASPRAGAEALTFKEVITMMRQHIWLVIFFPIAGFIIGVLSWYLLLTYFPRYTANSYVEVLSPVERDPLKIGENVIDRERQYNYRMSLAMLITEQGMLGRLLEVRRDIITPTEWFKSFGTRPERKAEAADKALKDLKKHLRASVDRDSDFIRISMTCLSGREAALIANQMTIMFVGSRENEEQRDAKVQIQVLDKQITAIKLEISGYSKELNRIRQESTLSDLEERPFQDIYTQRLAFLEIQNNSLLIERSNLEAQLKALERQATGPITEQVAAIVENDATVILLTQQGSLLQSELASAYSKYGQNHRVVRQIQERLAEIENRKLARSAEIGEIVRRANLINGQDTLSTLVGRLEQIEGDIKKAEQQKRDLDNAKFQYDENITKRTDAQARLAEMTKSIEGYNLVLNNPDIPKVRRAADAVAPLEASFPRWEVFFPGGAVLGLIIGVALAFAIELLNDLVRTPRDIARFLRVSQLGVIPDADEDERLENIEPSLALVKSPYSVVAEAYRNLRSNVRLLLSPGSKSILVTSPFAEDGKTSVAVNLAASLAAQGLKVLLIDANFWKPKLKILFPASELQRTLPKKKNEEENQNEQQNGNVELGLSTVLAGLCGYHEVLRPSGIANCDIVDAGELAVNPAELLGSPQMAQFIKHQSEKYNYIIVDGPPALLVGDVKQLAKIVDGTILVFNAAGTKRGTAQRIISDLQQVNANILGCVLFAVRYIKGGYFRKQFKAYQDYQKAQFAKAAAS